MADATLTGRAQDGAGKGLVLLTGATGYVGGRLLPALVEKGWAVRCLTRRRDAIEPRAGVEVVCGDLLNVDSLGDVFDGVTRAFYLVHSMDRKGEFEDRDRTAARNFAAGADEAGVARVIYLGGLASADQPLSPHMRSRIEVGRILGAASFQTVEFRASIIIGAGSLSYEMIRALVDRLPVMVTPRWVSTMAQPIAIGDVVAYLVAGLDAALEGDQVFEIGGADRMSYGEIMREFARQRGVRRLMIPVPVLTPRLSSLWLKLVTPLYARVGRRLIESIRHESVVRDERALDCFDIRPVSTGDAITAALEEARALDCPSAVAD